MTELLCLGCAVVVIIGTVFRFTMLAQGLSEAKLLMGWCSTNRT